MATATAKRKYTYEDYLTFPDDLRCELIDGEVYEWNRPDEDREVFLERLQRALAGEPYTMTPSPRTKHQAIAGSIFFELFAFVRKHEAGWVLNAPTDVKLSENIVVQPDILFISKERLSMIMELNIQGAPDLVVEVLSPSTAFHDRQRKTELYARHGVREYWMVDPDKKTVERLDLKDGVYLVTLYGENDVLESSVLPGLRIELSLIFSRE